MVFTGDVNVSHPFEKGLKGATLTFIMPTPVLWHINSKGPRSGTILTVTKGFFDILTYVHT